MPEIPVLTIGVAAGASITVERITEWLLKILFALIADFAPVWEEKLSGGVKVLLTAGFNMLLYAVLFRLDFVSPVVVLFGASISPWQGTVISILLVGGGSQLVHEFFGYFRKGNGNS